MRTVNVLMSVYNGEKYLEEQIESILNQSYPNVELYVRDDGSSDNSLKLLEKYEKKGKIKLLRGENLGYTKSFFTLLENADDEAEYFAFADQDDVWDEKKIEYAINRLEENSGEVKIYYSNYDICDDQLEFREVGYSNPRPNFSSVLLQCPTNGFTIVLNTDMRKDVLSYEPQYAVGHDWWVCLIGVTTGNVVVDSRTTAKWRRNISSVTTNESAFLPKLKYRFRLIFKENYFGTVRKQLKEFSKAFDSKLTDEQKNLLYLFLDNNFSLTRWSKKLFYKKRYSFRLIDELFFRLCIFIGLL
ncbi:glycosyltransferase [Lactococcus lactis]|uniref:glycosyltransferase n=1 Tax=Lactococcus lactis TaxID=1358 RepID=UPI001782EAA4|nr:glycosyltransferase [Lactococcus lactis]